VDLSASLGVYVISGHVKMLAAGGLTAAVFEVVMSGIRSGLLKVSEDRVGTFDGEVAQEPAPAFPKFQVGHLHQVLYQGAGRFTPEGGRA
jgi:hypothetical protein